MRLLEASNKNVDHKQRQYNKSKAFLLGPSGWRDMGGLFPCFKSERDYAFWLKLKPMLRNWVEMTIHTLAWDRKKLRIGLRCASILGTWVMLKDVTPMAKDVKLVYESQYFKCLRTQMI